MNLVPENINEAIKHLKPQSDVAIDNDTFATITLYTRTGLFIKNLRLMPDRQNNNIYPEDFAWLGKDVKTLNEFITELKNIAKAHGRENIYEIKLWKTFKTITWGKQKNLLLTIDNADELGYLDEAIKHLKPINREDVKKRLREVFNDTTYFENLGKRVEKYKIYSNEPNYQRMVEEYEKLAEAMDSDMEDLYRIEDRPRSNFSAIDKFFEVLAYKADLRMNIPVDNALYHVYPRLKIAYRDQDDYYGSWIFDLPYIVEHLDEYIDIFSIEKITESIKHLEPRKDDEIKEVMKDYGLYDKFFTATAENLPDVIDELIASKEYDELSSDDVRLGLMSAAMHGNKEIVKILIEKGGADPRDVALDYIDASIVPMIKQYRKLIKNKR